MNHVPVLLNEVLRTLGDINGKTVVDCTFGAGGYSRAFLCAGANVIAFDRDSSVMPAVEKIKSEYGPKFQFINGPFSEIGTILCPPTGPQPRAPTPPQGGSNYDAIVFDLGVSSMQIDTAERGFSFRFDGPLDMRMGGGAHLQSAAELIENSSAEELTGILREYGDIKNARGLANKIIARRPQTTFELKDLIGNPRDIAPVFQALRIAVNDEMGELERALAAVPMLLNAGGICVCVTFHSLEDRLVKNIFREWTDEKGDPRLPAPVDCRGECKFAQSEPGHRKGEFTFAPTFRLLKTFKPSESELEINPRARSAHLRAVQKV